MGSFNQNALLLLRRISKEHLTGTYLTQLSYLCEHLNWLGGCCVLVFGFVPPPPPFFFFFKTT